MVFFSSKILLNHDLIFKANGLTAANDYSVTLKCSFLCLLFNKVGNQYPFFDHNVSDDNFYEIQTLNRNIDSKDMHVGIMRKNECACSADNP